MARRNMHDWVKEVLDSDKRLAFPLMPYIGLELTGRNILDAVRDGQIHGQCIRAVASRYPSAASITFMDLSVEAEAFGSTTLISENEIPASIGTIVRNAKSAQALECPRVGSGRTVSFLAAASLASRFIKDRPVFGCHIGPFSLAARLCGMTEIMVKIRKEPGMMHTLLEKCTDFLVEYAKAFKDIGVDGILIAEPAAGLVSPVQCEAFSSKYVSRIVSAVQDEGFMVILHNCGNTLKHVPSILGTGVMGIHFGNAVDMADIMPQVPPAVLVLGNVDPVLFKKGSIEDVRVRTTELLVQMRGYRNFVLSSGCDVPPGTPLGNIDEFFAILDTFNGMNGMKSCDMRQPPPAPDGKHRNLSQ